MTALRRTTVTIVDQALSSASNFGVALIVARTVSPGAFGAFGIAFTIYLVALGASRALASDPLSIRFSNCTSDTGRVAARSATGTSLVLGLAAGATCALASLLTPHALAPPLLALGLTLPGLLVQDTYRFVFISAAQPARARANAHIWVAAQVLLFGLLLSLGPASETTLLGAWGAAATIAALAAVLQARVRPSPRLCGSWFRSHRALSLPLLGDYATTTGTTYVVAFALAALGGLAAAGALRAAQVLTGPLNIVALGLVASTVSEGARLRGLAPHRVMSLLRSVSLVQAALCAVWGTILLAMPEDLGELVLGETWPRAEPVLAPMTAYLAASGLALGAICGLRVFEAANRSVRTRLRIAPALLLGGVVGAAADGARGAAIGMALANGIACAVWWRQFLIAARQANAPSSAPASITTQTSLFEPAVSEGAIT